eukprot:c24396_g1_i1 orf=500-1393(+)
MKNVHIIVFAAVLLAIAFPLSQAHSRICVKGSECTGELCCNKTISEIFTVDHFEAFFPQRNNPLAHAQGFWDYHSFITAASLFEPLGFGTMGGDQIQKEEVSAFFAHVAHETTCGWSMALKGPYAWGLCYKEELSPDKLYCEPSYEYPCSPGISYHGRGALPVYWNYNYGEVGVALKYDGLHHPEYLSQNATLAFEAAIWRWMTPMKKNQASCHDVMVGKWVPTKNDTYAYRTPGFGMTINILNGFVECGHGDDTRMIDRISHFLTFLDIIGVGRDNAGSNLSCGLQGVLNSPFASS